MSEMLFSFLETPGPLPYEFKKDIEAIMRPKSFLKGQLLVREGPINNNLFFIQKGIVRCYYYDRKRKQKTDWFMQEGELIALADSFYFKKACDENVEAVENCETLTLTFEELEQLYAKYPSFERNGRFLTMYHSFYFRKRFRDKELLSIKERYQNLLTESPELIQRVPVNQIASFLGTNKFYLSRIRRQIKS